MQSRLFFLLSSIILASCGGGGSDNGDTDTDERSLVIKEFNLSSNSTAITGVPINFSWNIEASADSSVTCTLDIDSRERNGQEYTIENCNSSSSQSHTYSEPGSYLVTLTIRSGNSATSVSDSITVSGTGSGTGSIEDYSLNYYTNRESIVERSSPPGGIIEIAPNIDGSIFAIRFNHGNRKAILDKYSDSGDFIQTLTVDSSAFNDNQITHNENGLVLLDQRDGINLQLISSDGQVSQLIDVTEATNFDEAHQLAYTSEGGFVLFGEREGEAGNETFIVKVNASGEKQWELNTPDFFQGLKILTSQNEIHYLESLETGETDLITLNHDGNILNRTRLLTALETNRYIPNIIPLENGRFAVIIFDQNLPFDSPERAKVSLFDRDGTKQTVLTTDQVTSLLPADNANHFISIRIQSETPRTTDFEFFEFNADGDEVSSLSLPPSTFSDEAASTDTFDSYQYIPNRGYFGLETKTEIGSAPGEVFKYTSTYHVMNLILD